MAISQTMAQVHLSALAVRPECSSAHSSSLCFREPVRQPTMNEWEFIPASIKIYPYFSRNGAFAGYWPAHDSYFVTPYDDKNHPVWIGGYPAWKAVTSPPPPCPPGHSRLEALKPYGPRCPTDEEMACLQNRTVAEHHRMLVTSLKPFTEDWNWVATMDDFFAAMALC